jgi:type II secretory pathway pseudopilin PulG
VLGAPIQNPKSKIQNGLRAFTIIELIVVITMIVLVLAIALPSLGALNADARLTAAYQLINGTLTQAYFLAAADKNMTAVRFLPGVWDSPDAAGAGPSGRQHMVIYRYVGTTDREQPPGSGTFVMEFGEYCVRQPGTASVRLPEDVWIAPLEAVQASGGSLGHGGGWAPTTISAAQWRAFMLGGVLPNLFAYDPDPAGGDPNAAKFMNADDFLMVVDPQSGVRTGTPAPYALRAYAPPLRYDTDRDRNVYYQRYGFSGVVVYRREAFVAAGSNQDPATVQARQDYLRRTGRAYMAQRFGGGLSAALQRPQ